MILPYNVKFADGTTVRVNASDRLPDEVIAAKAGLSWIALSGLPVNGRSQVRPPAVVSIQAVIARFMASR